MAKLGVLGLGVKKSQWSLYLVISLPRTEQTEKTPSFSQQFPSSFFHALAVCLTSLRAGSKVLPVLDPPKVPLQEK